MAQPMGDCGAGERRWPSLAIVGCGAWGRNLARNFNALGVLTAVCDHNAGHANAMAKQYGVPAIALDELLGDATIAAVALATPSLTHYDIAREALVAAKHVFVEKPIALDPKHAAELDRIAMDRGLALMVGHVLQYHPAFERLLAMFEAGELGDARYIGATRLNGAPDRHEPSVVWDLAPHDISMMLALLHELPTCVTALSGGRLASVGSKVALAALEFHGGCMAHLHMSWIHPHKQRRFVVVGTEATVVFDDSEDWPRKLVRYPAGTPGGEGAPIQLTTAEPLAAECRHFLDCIVSNRQPRTNGREGHAVLRVLHAIDDAIARRVPVEIASDDESDERHAAVQAE